MSFLAEPNGSSLLVRTETRVFATDDYTRFRFAAYWRVIYPGSALILRTWLGAIKRRGGVVHPCRHRSRVSENRADRKASNDARSMAPQK